MRSAQSLAQAFTFDAWPTFENLPVLYERISAMFSTGRSITLIEYYVHDGAEPQLDVKAGLRLDRRPGREEAGSLSEDLERRVRSMHVALTRLEGLRLVGDDEATEEVLAQRFRAGERLTWQITVSGRGTGVDDFVEHRYRNEYGVLQVRRFQFEDRDARVVTED